jgi:YD repeat-containing protein
MKNIFGTTEIILLKDENGTIRYHFYKRFDGVLIECIYDNKGSMLNYKDQTGNWRKLTYDENDNELTYKNSDGYTCERTYDEQGNKLTFKNSIGEYRIKGKRVTKEEFEAFIQKQLIK